MNKCLSKYTHLAIDVDNSQYLVINSDVVMYRKGMNKQIDAILSHFEEIIDNSAELQLFIKGNRLFFTLEGVKYWHILTCWANEWDYIEQVIEALKSCADDVAYKVGELD